MIVMVFEQRFLESAHYVPDLVRTKQDKIYQFLRGLGGEYTDKMIVVPYMSFNEAVIAALHIEAQNVSVSCRLEPGAPSQGPLKRIASTSGSGSSIGSGYGSSSSSGPRFRTRFRGRSRRPTRNQLGVRQSGQFSLLVASLFSLDKTSLSQWGVSSVVSQIISGGSVRY